MYRGTSESVSSWEVYAILIIIVQFMGICFLPESRLPVQVMEYLSSNLDAFLEKQANIPLFLKRSILHDVARGLVYLHCRMPPVIHRDLTARNVLLSSMMTAKIADFGNSRLVDFATQTLTCFPGTLAYLPPEALDPHPQYDMKLDMVLIRSAFSLCNHPSVPNALATLAL